MSCFFFLSLSGGVAPGQPATTMIMEGLDTLVPPSHHTFLALQDHFNAFCFDTVGSFMKTAATPTSFHLNNNNNSSIPNNNNNNIIGATPQTSSSSSQITQSHHNSLHHLQAQQELRHPSAAVTTISANNNNSNSNNNNNSNTSLNNSNNNSSSSASVTNKNCNNNIASSIASSSCNNSSSTTSIITASATIITSSGGHPTLSLPSVNTQQNSIAKVSEANNNNNSGDLNTPVTTASDIPSFFGPSTVVEPPPITSKYLFFSKFSLNLTRNSYKYHKNLIQIKTPHQRNATSCHDRYKYKTAKTKIINKSIMINIQSRR